MKKLIVVPILIVLLLVGIMSGVVMAAPPDKPIDSWAYISDKVDAIWSAVIGVQSSVNVTDAKVDAVQSSVNATHSDVGDLYDAAIDMNTKLDAIGSNVTNMETDSGVIVIPANTDPFDVTVIGGNYTEIRHVVVTLYVYPGVLDEVGDRIYVSAYWPGAPGGWNVATFDDGSGYKATTFDFNADYWIIWGESDSSGYTIRYAVTTTFVPAAP
jgi:hypothetical protein